MSHPFIFLSGNLVKQDWAVCGGPAPENENRFRERSTHHHHHRVRNRSVYYSPIGSFKSPGKGSGL